MPYTTLISTESLARHQADCLIIDCRFSLSDTDLGEKLYRQGHISGAHYAHLDRHLSRGITPKTGRHPLPDFDTLASQLGLWGISERSQVVVYDDAAGSFASRLWWLLRTLGHPKVAVLEGGIQAWLAAGELLETELPACSPAQFKPALIKANWLDIEPLQQVVGSLFTK